MHRILYIVHNKSTLPNNPYLNGAVLEPGVGDVSYLPGGQLVVVVEDQHLLQIVFDRLAPLALLPMLVVVESSNPSDMYIIYKTMEAVCTSIA